MSVVAERTFDADEIRAVMTHPDMWATIAEDGQNPDDYSPDMDSTAYLLMRVGGETVGLYTMRAVNAVTLEMHVNVVKAHRRRHSHATGIAALRWVYHNAEKYQKIVAQIPVIYGNVKRFALDMGFQLEGVNRLSYQKNGEIMDQWALGATRGEIEAILYE